MRKRILFGLVLMLAVAARSASADTITIGEFQWADPFGFGPQLSLLNYADTPLATDVIPADFTGGRFEDVVLTPVFADSGSTFGDTPPAIVAAGDSWFGLFDPLESANLSFTFLYAFGGMPLSQTYSLNLSQSEADAFGFSNRLIDFTLPTTSPTTPAPVPEPGTFALIASGLAFGVARFRSWSTRPD